MVEKRLCEDLEKLGGGALHCAVRELEDCSDRISTQS